MPLALTDNQLRIVTAIAVSVPVEKRDAYLQRFVAQLRFLTGGRLSDDTVGRAAKIALKGLMWAPAA
jgi:hypothetical protein